MTTLERVPLMETTAVACWLALAAGSMDGFTFLSVQTFSTAQSGNVVQIGYWIANGDGGKFVDVSIAVLAFGVGAATIAAIRTLVGRGGHVVSFHILLFEAAVLFAVGLPFVGGDMDPLVVAYFVSFLAGMQGNAFHRAGGMLVGNVAATRNLQLGSNFLAQSVFGDRRENLRKSAIYFLVLLAFATGGLIGGIAATRVDEYALWIPAALLLGLGVMALGESRRRPVDPRP